MKISKLSQRLFNLIVNEVRNEITYNDAHDIDYCSTYVLDDVLERFNIRSCKNRDHLARLERACGATHYVERQGVVSLTAQQMQPVIANDWWLHTPEQTAPLREQPLELITLAKKIGLDLAQLDWTGMYGYKVRYPKTPHPQPWDNSKFLWAVRYQLWLGGLRDEYDVQALQYIISNPVRLVAHPSGSENTLTLECHKVGEYVFSNTEVSIKTHTHRQREWRCGRAVGKLLVQMMHTHAKGLRTPPRKVGTGRTRPVPNVGIDPHELTVWLKRGVYLEY